MKTPVATGNALLRVDRRTDRHLRAPHTKVAHGYRRMGIASAIWYGGITALGAVIGAERVAGDGLAHRVVGREGREVARVHAMREPRVREQRLIVDSEGAGRRRGSPGAYVEYGLGKTDAVQKWWYFGPMFRAERPQKGRYRQFY